MEQQEYKDLKKFKTLIGEIRTAGFIMADRKITNLLKFIASSDLLFNLMDKSLLDFNFEYEYMTACVMKAVDSDGKSYFVLPSNLKNRIALIFSILYYIDDNMLEFVPFLNEFYMSEDTSKTYMNFVKAVIDPFEEDVELSITGVSQMREDFDFLMTTEEEEITTFEVESIFTELKYLENVLITTKKLDENEKMEIHTLLNNFSNCIAASDLPTSKIAWLGIKNSIKKVPRTSSPIATIETILKKFD